MLSYSLALASSKSTIYFIHSDHLGTPQYLSDQSGALVSSIDHHPYGEVSSQSRPISNRLTLPGQYVDTETRLHYNYYRYHDTSIGRYHQSDLIGLRGGFALYAYANNNPILYVDPLGLEGMTISLGAGGAFVNGSISASADSRVAIDNTGRICIQSVVCGTGDKNIEESTAGLAGELGVVIGASEGLLCEMRESESTEAFALGGAGGAILGAVGVNTEDGLSGSRILIGVGALIGGGTRTCITRTVYCLN